MRIAVVTESFLPRTDGVVRTVCALLDFLHRHDHHCIVFAAGPGPDRYRGFRVERVPGVPFPAYPALTIAPLSLAMSAHMRQFKPDIVHLASPFVLGVQGRRVGARLGIPVAAHYQTDIVRYSRYYGLGYGAALAQRHVLRLHNRCQVTYAPTKSIARDLETQGFTNVRVSGRGVDTTMFHPDKRSEGLRRSLLRGDEQYLLLYVGRLSSEKNLESLKSLIAQTPGCRLVLVGEGPHRQALEHHFSALPVTFAGLKHGEELAAYYASADVFVFPSETETFGQVVQEAMASALPVVAVRAGGVQDLFLHGSEGILIAPGDSRAWRSSVQALLEDRAQAQRLGAHARRAAEGRTWEAVHTRLLEEYGVLARCLASSVSYA